ncbi:hypothetical protein Tco_0797192 [Tanacetum coccineum]
MSTSNQQTLAKSGATDRPPILEKGNYIPWKSQFRRFLENKGKDGERMLYSIIKGPYVWPMIADPDDPRKEIHEPISKMTKANRKQYTTEVRVMNYLLQAIPNDIYNSVDACKDAQKMWEQIRRLSTLVNVMDRNDVRPIKVSINTKFLNSLQPEWSKYVTLTRQNKDLSDVEYDLLYDNLLQFEPHVQASKAKKAVKNHDPLALIAHSS